MIKDELINHVAQQINNVESKWMVPTEQHIKYATVAVDAIFEALKDPSEEMVDAARHLMMWLEYQRPTTHALHFMHDRMGKPLPDNCPDNDHVPPKALRAAWVFQAMIKASPIAPVQEDDASRL